MKKLLLFLLLSFGFMGSANADAVCNDGWISESEGSGTCSWHGGVREWLPDGWCQSDCECSSHKLATALGGAKRYGMYYASAMEGCLYEKNLQDLASFIINAAKQRIPVNAYSSGNSWRCNAGYRKRGNSCQRIYVPPHAYVSGSSWKCLSGYKKTGNQCQKIFVANFYDGVEAYQKGDYKEAIKHWELLANNGNANAQFNLGKMYEKGMGVTKSDYHAFQWINKAAKLGHTNAQYTLGYMYRNGSGVVKNANQTVKWFKEAGKKGHAKAQFNLGAMYINGDVVVKSMTYV